MTLSEQKNKDQARKIERAKRDYAAGISERERDTMLHLTDLMRLGESDGQEPIRDNSIVKGCRKRFLRDFYPDKGNK